LHRDGGVRSSNMNPHPPTATSEDSPYEREDYKKQSTNELFFVGPDTIVAQRSRRGVDRVVRLLQVVDHEIVGLVLGVDCLELVEEHLGDQLQRRLVGLLLGRLHGLVQAADARLVVLDGLVGEVLEAHRQTLDGGQRFGEAFGLVGFLGQLVHDRHHEGHELFINLHPFLQEGFVDNCFLS